MLIMLEGPVVPMLRAQYPRVPMAELVSRIAGFPEHCWASASYLGAEIGRSARTVFRLLARLRADGLLVTRTGSRYNFPPRTTPMGQVKLHHQGYVLRGFGGSLEPLVAQGRSLLASRKTARERKSEANWERRRRRALAEQRAAHAEYNALFPELAKRFGAEPTSKREAPSGVALDTRAGVVLEVLDELVESYDVALDELNASLDGTGPPD